jgi:osmoprotectant transport system ATP-binding protein
VIRIRDLEKGYPGWGPLRIPDWEIPASRTVAIVGPSGCGKSTLLRLIMGLIEPDRGFVEIEGEPLSVGLRPKMGYVIQEGGLFPHLTARENVALPARRLGWREDRVGRRLDELCALARFEPELLGRYPLQLSGGQRQRVSLMRALVLDPPILLLDEPLGGLDPMIRAGLQVDLRAVFETLRKCVLFVTHDMAEAAAVGDEIALLREGAILQRGSARDLVETPADPFVAEFIRAQKPPEGLWG